MINIINEPLKSHHLNEVLGLVLEINSKSVKHGY